MKLDDLLQRDPFGEKLITITGHDLNQTQIDKFLARMSKFGGAGKGPQHPFFAFLSMDVFQTTTKQRHLLRKSRGQLQRYGIEDLTFSQFLAIY